MLLLAGIPAVILLAAGALVVLTLLDRVHIQTPVLVKEASIVTYKEGEALLQAGDGEEWLPAEIGARIKAGYRLRTGPDGVLDVRLLTGNVVRLAADTLMSVEALTLKRQTVDLQQGLLFAKFTQMFKKQTIRVNTPTAVAGVRGTELIFDAEEAEGRRQTTVYSLSGITEIMNPALPARRILLAFQSKTVVAEGQPPMPPEDMTPDEIRGYRKTFNSMHAEKVLLVSYDIGFAPDSAAILESSETRLDWVYRLVKQSRYTILIAGHTADIGIDDAQYRLSVERAQAIKDYLVSRGIRPARLAIAGFGGTRPIADNDNSEGRARNRRVEFLVLD